jgi:endonuclease YncB( thermonuclease family)
MSRSASPRRLGSALLLILLALVSAGASPAQAAEPASGKCRMDGTGPTCKFWYGKVAFIADGDTFDFDVDGDGSHRVSRVRVTGINAMEHTVYSKYADRRRGACHALEATARLEQLVRASRWRVRLAAQHASSRTGKRLRRQASVKIGGRWTDVGAILMAEGHTLWLPNGDEWAWNKQYATLAQQAAAQRINLWNPAACGVGPQQDVPVQVWGNWDADGADPGNLNGEWIKVKNPSAQTLDVSGWLVRDSFHREYVFRPGTTIAPGRSLYVHSGRGSDSPEHLYWNLGGTIFENVSSDGRGVGDGAYVYDNQGDLRAYFMYPCIGACAADPAVGSIDLTVQPKNPESMTLTNVGGSPIDLEGYVLKVHQGSGYSHVLNFDPGTVIGPGERLVVWGARRASTSRLELSWQKSKYILSDGGNAVDLRNLNDVLIDCYAWGSGRC